MNRASRKRANKRRRRIEAGQVTLGHARRLLSGWQTEVEYRARITFQGPRHGGEAKKVLAVWALASAKLDEAKRLERCCPEISVVEELLECCRQAVARHMPYQKVQLGPCRSRFEPRDESIIQDLLRNGVGGA